MIASSHIDADLLVSAKPARTRLLLIAVIVFQSLVAIKMFARDESDPRSSKSTTLETVVVWLLITIVTGVAVWHIPTVLVKELIRNKNHYEAYALGLRFLYELLAIHTDTSVDLSQEGWANLVDNMLAGVKADLQGKIAVTEVKKEPFALAKR